MCLGVLDFLGPLSIVNLHSMGFGRNGFPFTSFSHIYHSLKVNPEDLNTFTVKGQWCLQGHLDPDLSAKAELGMLKSPTLSQLGRMCLVQTIASHKWELQLGDIKEHSSRPAP